MDNKINIEDLFKNTLENAEANPPAGAWEAIQAKMGATAASTAAGTAATGLGIGKIAAIVVTALGVGLGAGYLAFKNTDKEPRKEISPANTETNNTTAEENLVSENNLTLPEDVQITELSSVRTADKIVQEVEVTTKGEDAKTIRMKISQPSVSAERNNGSVVNQWLSPNKDKINRQEMIRRIMDELDKADTEETITEPAQPKNNVSKENNIEKEKPVEAVIVSVINKEDPLTVSFSNLTPASQYEWDFGDNTFSKEERPVHTYTNPGFYPVTLKVYDKWGKVYTHKDGVQVSAKEEATVVEESSINKPNIFTPNGDGKSDEFYFTGKNIESFALTILDMNNRTVFSSNDINQHWNGTDKGGNLLPQGKYICTFKAIGKDKKVYQDTYFIMLMGR